MQPSFVLFHLPGAVENPAPVFCGPPTQETRSHQRLPVGILLHFCLGHFPFWLLEGAQYLYPVQIQLDRSPPGFYFSLQLLQILGPAVWGPFVCVCYTWYSRTLHPCRAWYVLQAQLLWLFHSPSRNVSQKMREGREKTFCALVKEKFHELLVPMVQFDSHKKCTVLDTKIHDAVLRCSWYGLAFAAARCRTS